MVIDISYQYQLKKFELEKLFKKRNRNFEPLITNVAYQAIKNTCIQFSADDYLEVCSV